MRLVPLEAKHSYVAPETERSEEAAIVGEIARHLLELREHVSAKRSAGLIGKLHAIHKAENDALWFVLRLLTGDLSEITRSYTDIGKENHRSKQAVQQSLERAIIALELHWPEVAKTVIQLRNITAQHGNV